MKIKLSYEGQDFGGHGNFIIDVLFEDGTYGSLVCEGTISLQAIPGKSTLTFTVEKVMPKESSLTLEEMGKV